MEAKVLDAMKAAAPLNFEKAGEIAEKFGLKQRAVVASAIRNEIPYENKVRVSKTGEPVVTKEDLVGTIADGLGLEAKDLTGLEKATKAALTKVAAGFNEVEVEFEAE